MDFSRAWRTLSEDSDWLVKILIGGVMVLLSFLIVPVFLVQGYQVDVMRRAAAGDDRLPAWDDWGGLFVRGATAIVISLVYALPVILIACCMGVAGLAVSGSASGGQANPNPSLNAFLACLGCLAIPLALFAAFFSPAAILRYVTHQDIAAAFKIGEVWALIRDNLTPYLLAFLAAIVLPLIASLVSGVLCGLPAPWLAFVAGVLSYHLYGQVAQGQRGQVGPAPLAPMLPPSA